MFETEEIIIKKRIEEIHAILGGGNIESKIVSLKIIYPKDSKLDALKTTLTLIEDVEYGTYRKMENMFVYNDASPPNGSDIQKTLTFLQYDESYKYECLNPRNHSSIKKYGYKFISERDVDLNSENSEDLKNKDRLTHWNDWIQCIEQHFPYGKSTLWSYFKIRIAGYDSIIASSYLIFSEEITTENDENILIKINRICKELLIQVISVQYHKEIMESCTRAAISQLYARTDAHDLGHVLDAYKSENDLFSDETEKQYIYICHNNSILSNAGETGFLDRKCKISPNCSYYPRLLGYFNQFLKTRMDFRADVATTDPSSLTTLDFYKDIFLQFNNNLIFNNRISGIDDLELKYKFTIKNNNNRNKDVSIPVAIPNDILGCHAMYIIWSNVIRNTVKHGELTNKSELEFTIEIVEFSQNPDYYEVSLYSNDYKENDITGKLVVNRNKAFDDTVLDKETNRLRESALGSIEMDSCAAYLRKMPVVSIEDKRYKLLENDNLETTFKENGIIIPKIIYAYSQAKDNLYSSLGYKFYLLKPKDILVICDNIQNTVSALIDNTSFEEYNKSGIDFIEYKDLSTSIYNHKFLVFIREQESLSTFLSEIEDKKLLSSIPKRRIAFNDSENFSTIDEFKKKCWEKWITGFRKKIIIKNNDDNTIFSDVVEENNYLSVRLYNHATNLSIDQLLLNNEYHEMICGHHWTQKLKLNKNQFIEGVNYLQYLEGVFTNVMIIDERIQKHIVLQGKQYGEKIPFALYFEQMGIYMPSPQIENNRSFINSDNNYTHLHKDDPNLNATNLMEEKNRIKIYINDNIERVSFVVIHLGVIEKLIENKNEIKDTSLITNVIYDLLADRSQSNKIIITSGRGKPNNLDSRFSFVSISLLQNAIETMFDKYRLIQILYNSRRTL
ncbi:hypothetical protein LJB85_02410 [Porphyromonadaceae bacterium OttesenSCG-928-L07]|nr:hypothetical protein [Porphyromonadaceae bacterium OttesenSCG-928-L07]